MRKTKGRRISHGGTETQKKERERIGKRKRKEV
jgi:hypothetical protein